MKTVSMATHSEPGNEGESLHRLLILIPVYNDWASLQKLLPQVDEAMGKRYAGLTHVEVLVVDDGSTEPPPTFDPESHPHLDEVNLLRLTCNVGHQRAIALGLAWSHSELQYDAVVIMDGDGEDVPNDVLQLLQASNAHPEGVIIAERAKRSEGFVFRLGYRAFRVIHRLTTGKAMRFGNFCLLRRAHVRALIAGSAVWNHFAAGIVYAKLPLVFVPTNRGLRLAGRSHMNYVALVVHGLSAIAVHLETVGVRLLLGAMGLFGLVVMAMFAVISIRLFTDRAIPGWASTLSVLFGLAALQLLFVSVFLVFIILHNRTQRLFVPAVDFRVFIGDVRTGSSAFISRQGRK